MKIARSREGMVVAAHRLAAEAGCEALAEGANAVEAAVAVSLALGVVEPFASSLGGGGYMMISPQGSAEKTEGQCFRRLIGAPKPQATSRGFRKRRGAYERRPFSNRAYITFRHRPF